MGEDVLQQFWARIQADEELAGQEIFARWEEKLVYLSGTCATWAQVVRCGHIAGALPGVKGVINDIKVRG